MSGIFANWRTSLAGAGAVLGGLAHMLTTISHGDTGSLATDIPIILSGVIGIFAKDSNK